MIQPGPNLTRLYDEHAQGLYGFLCYRTGDPVLAEDLLADTFERALRAGHRFDRRKASERTWLYAIALNCVRDNARHIAAETRALSRVGATHVAESAAPAAGLERRAALRTALATLRAEEREALALRYGADLMLSDIARATGEPRSTVEARIYGGLRKLRELLEPGI